MLNDFQQYWLGAYVNVSDGGTDPDGEPYQLIGVEDEFAGFTGDLNAAGSAGNQDHTALLLTTSSFLPPDQFPQFASAAPVGWDIPGGPFDPHTGEWYVYSQQADVTYKRLTRTVDLSGATSGELSSGRSYDTEADWDFLFVEAHEVGSDDVDDAAGRKRPHPGGTQARAVPKAGASCTRSSPTTRDRTANRPGPRVIGTQPPARRKGWSEWSVDLSGYAGTQVEVSISYVSDWGTQGIGVFLDDVTVLVDGAAVAETGFEADLGGWTVVGSPEGSAGEHQRLDPDPARVRGRCRHHDGGHRVCRVRLRGACSSRAGRPRGSGHGAPVALTGEARKGRPGTGRPFVMGALQARVSTSGRNWRSDLPASEPAKQ